MVAKLFKLDYKVFTITALFATLIVIGNGLIYLNYVNTQELFSFIFITITYSVGMFIWMLSLIINYFINFFVDELDKKKIKIVNHNKIYQEE